MVSPDFQACECADDHGCWCDCFVVLRLRGNLMETRQSVGRERTQCIIPCLPVAGVTRGGWGVSECSCIVCCIVFCGDLLLCVSGREG